MGGDELEREIQKAIQEGVSKQKHHFIGLMEGAVALIQHINLRYPDLPLESILEEVEAQVRQIEEGTSPVIRPGEDDEPS